MFGFDVITHEIYILLDIEYAAVCATCLDDAVVCSGFHILPFECSVPATCRIVPFIQFLAPAVDNNGLKLYNTLIPRLGAIGII